MIILLLAISTFLAPTSCINALKQRVNSVNCSSLLCNYYLVEESAWADDCSCSPRPEAINIVCPEWSAESFIVEIHPYPFARKKVVLNGLNKQIPFKFIGWFLHNLLTCSLGVWFLDISNFCPVNSESTKVDINGLSLNRQTSLQVLKISNNCLEFISYGLDPTFSSLQNLDLSFNKLKQIPMANYTFLSLQKLDVSHNLISNVSRTNFEIFPDAEILNLSVNVFENLSPDLFFDLAELEILDLSHNSISEVPLTLLFKNRRLKRLNLSNNNLTSLPNDFLNHSRYLEKLDLSNNPIELGFSFIFEKLRKLEELNLDSTNVKVLYINIFYGLWNIKRISLRNNYFTALPTLIILNANVHLDFSHNNITTLESPPTRRLQRTRTLSVDVSHNCIWNYSDYTYLVYTTGSSVLTVKCSHCCLDSVNPYMLFGLTEELDLSNNKITEFDLSGFSLQPIDNRIIRFNLSRNQISKLPMKDDPHWYRISVLDLSHNGLKSLKNMTVTPNLRILYLDYNSLTEFDDVIDNLLSSNVTAVKLAGNRWNCDCRVQNLVINSPLFIDKHLMRCVNDNVTYNFTEIERLCIAKKADLSLLWLLLPITILIIVVSVLIVFYFKFKAEILYYLFSKGILLKFVCEEDIDAEKEYDAFVSYSHEDEDWVVDYLLPGLETGIPAYKLCLHNRDWRGGEFITDQIVRSVQNSRRTIIVLTDSFLKSEWSRLEFDVAYQQALRDKVRRLIVVVPTEVPDLSHIKDEFRTFITLTTYIQASKPYFWRKLRASMPRIATILTSKEKRPTFYNYTFDAAI